MSEKGNLDNAQKKETWLERKNRLKKQLLYLSVASVGAITYVYGECLIQEYSEIRLREKLGRIRCKTTLWQYMVARRFPQRYAFALLAACIGIGLAKLRQPSF